MGTRYQDYKKSVSEIEDIFSQENKYTDYNAWESAIRKKYSRLSESQQATKVKEAKNRAIESFKERLKEMNQEVGRLYGYEKEGRDTSSLSGAITSKLASMAAMLKYWVPILGDEINRYATAFNDALTTTKGYTGTDFGLKYYDPETNTLNGTVVGSTDLGQSMNLAGSGVGVGSTNETLDYTRDEYGRYINPDTGEIYGGTTGGATGTTPQELVDQMSAGTLQPNLTNFREIYGTEGTAALDAYHAAMRAWRGDVNITGGATGTTAGGVTDTTGTTTGGVTGGTTTTGVADPNQAAIDYINSMDIPEAEKAIYRLTVQNTEIGEEFDIEKIIAKVNQIRNETIDPAYRAMADAAIADLTSSRDFQIAQRERGLEAERYNAGESIRQAQTGLEQSGMTFTGKGVEQLGAKSAYAQPTMEEAALSMMPTQQDFEGMFYEGTVNQANRLISSSSEAAYRQNMQALGRGAEDILGSTGALELNIPGYEAVGGQVGSLEQQRLQELASAASTAASQQDINEAYQQNTNYF